MASIFFMTFKCSSAGVLNHPCPSQKWQSGFLHIIAILTEQSLIIALYTSGVQSGRCGAAGTDTSCLREYRFSRHSPQEYLNIYGLKVRLKIRDEIISEMCSWRLKVTWKLMAKRSPNARVCVGQFRKCAFAKFDTKVSG